jgi:hypothetical protein
MMWYFLIVLILIPLLAHAGTQGHISANVVSIATINIDGSIPIQSEQPIYCGASAEELMCYF